MSVLVSNLGTRTFLFSGGDHLEPIIEIKNLSKTFGTGESQVAALQDVSLQIQKGEIFGIIGLSGAGKSTLVRCINLLERPDSGEILFHGKNLMHLKKTGGTDMHFYYDAQNRPSVVNYNGSNYAYIYNLQGDVEAITDASR